MANESDNENVEVKEQDTGKSESVKIESDSSNLPAELQGIDPNKLLSSLMADKDVQAVMNARQEGREVTVEDIVVDSDTNEEVSDEQRELEEDPEAKKLLELFENKLAPMKEELESLRSIAEAYERQGVDDQIRSTSKKHKDFDKYKPDMKDIVKKVSGLSVEEIYILAKHRKGDLDLAVPSTDSEKPSPSFRRRDARDKSKPARQGKKGFQQILIDGLDSTEETPEY